MPVSRMVGLPSAGLVTATAVLAVAIASHFVGTVPPLYDVPELYAHANSGEFFNWRGHAIFYKVSADSSDAPIDKPLMVLLHGFPTSSMDWRTVWAPLSENFTLLAFDFLGFGLSDKPTPYKYSLMEQADITEGLLQYAFPNVREYHIFAHDYGASVAQELLARKIDRKAKGDSETFPKPLSAVCLNGGIIPYAHKPMLMQRVLGNKFLGPIAKNLLINRYSFSYGLNKVFGRDTQLDEEQQALHWLLFSHKNGVAVIDKLLKYTKDRKAHSKRWIHALFDSDCPLAILNGPADPISGKHLFEAVLDEKNNRAKERQLARAHDSLQKHEPGKLVSYNPMTDDAVEAARKLDLYFQLPELIGHYPQLEDPQHTLRGAFAFYDGILKSHPSAA